MPHQITFLQPDPQDWQILEQIAEIDRQAFGEDGISVFNLSQFTRSGTVFCLTIGPVVVAEAVVLRNLHDSGAVIFGFAVSKNFQGKGFGNSLMEQLLQKARSLSISYFELTMNPENHAAKKLYIDKAGFVKKAELSLHPHKGEPRWLMHLDIGK
mgnify:FL=1